MKKLTHYTEEVKKACPESVSWQENHLSDSLYYSYRDTEYDRGSYPSRLHYHEYYELVVVLEGDIRYICGSSVYEPTCGTVVLIPPGALHMSVLHGDRTRYRRHVFYFYPDAFDGVDGSALLGFLAQCGEGRCFSLSDSKGELISLLERLNQALAKGADPLERALGMGYVLQIFYWLNRIPAEEPSNRLSLPENVWRLRQYLDESFAEITSVEQVADHFFYSREYVSRLFRKHFHITVSDYLRRRRIVTARGLIAEGLPLIEVCYRVGFGNLSTFIRAFEEITGMTPSQYRKMLRG